MQPEHLLRRQRKRRFTIALSVYWIVVVGALLLGFDQLIGADETVGMKWVIGVLGAAVAALLVHWGVLQTVALRE